MRQQARRLTLDLRVRHAGGQALADRLAEESRLALAEGARIDLRGCGYGGCEDGHFYTEPSGYYRYLAGLIRHKGFARVLEIGTHEGGSIRSMLRGVPLDRVHEARFVTVDITRQNDAAFTRFPENTVRRVQGDASATSTVDEVSRLFGDAPIDLLFIDSEHDYPGTGRQINIYANRHHPRLLVLDDIRLNASMRELWNDIVDLLGASRCFDASELVARPTAGFGVVQLRG